MTYFNHFDSGLYGNKRLEGVIAELTKDIPGWMHLHDLVWLARASMGRVVMEIGNYKGRSTRAMLPFARHIYCIDHFHPAGTIGQGYDPDSHGIRAEFEKNIAPWKDKVEIHEMFSQEAVVMEWPPIELLFIDGDHNYKTIVNDVGLIKFLVPGGIMALHDAEKAVVEKVIQTLSLVDQYLELEPGRSIRAFVNVSSEEWKKK